jgi:hypothetical protein
LNVSLKEKVAQNALLFLKKTKEIYNSLKVRGYRVGFFGYLQVFVCQVIMKKFISGKGNVVPVKRKQTLFNHYEILSFVRRYVLPRFL